MTKTEPRSAGSGGGRDKTQTTPTELLALAKRLDSEAVALMIFQGRVDESSDVSILREAAETFRTLATTLSAREDGYYLASFKHSGGVGGHILWWGPDNRGYTPDLLQAGIYTDPKPGYHDNGDDTVPVPVTYVQGLRIRHMLDPGDTGNGAFHSAKALREAIAAPKAPTAGEGRGD